MILIRDMYHEIDEMAFHVQDTSASVEEVIVPTWTCDAELGETEQNAQSPS
jgi:hypothetical protein